MSLWLVINLIGENPIYQTKYLESPLVDVLYMVLVNNTGRLSMLKILMDTLKLLLKATESDSDINY